MAKVDRWEFPRFGRFRLFRQKDSVLIVAPLLNRSTCGLSVWPAVPGTPRTRGERLSIVLIDGGSTAVSDDFHGLRLLSAQPRSDDPVGFPSRVSSNGHKQ